MEIATGGRCAVNVDVSGALASWRADAPHQFGDDYPALRQALIRRDAATVVGILDSHGQLDRLLPLLDDVEAIERAAEHDALHVVRTLDAPTLSALWGLTDDDLISVDEFA